MSDSMARHNTALILVDIQNDFLPPSGSLAVPNGRSILSICQQALDPTAFHWTLVVAGQVQGTKGCEIETGIRESLQRLLSSGRSVEIVKKGQDLQKEQYSVFDSSTGALDRLLKSYHISHLVCAGLAADFCVVSTARSALECGYHVHWLSAGTQAVAGPEAQLDIEAQLTREHPEKFRVISLDDLRSCLGISSS